MNAGRYVFAQVADFIPRYEFDRIVKKYNGDFHVRDLSCYNLFLHLMFGQLTTCDSIRDICLCLKAHQKILYPLGFRQTVNVSSLSRANRDRDCRIWEEFGLVLIRLVRPLYAKELAFVTNLTVKSFWGHSENAVKTHLWSAICTFLIVARIKASVKDCPYTITEVATLLGVSALSKTDISVLLTSQNNDLLNQNQDVNEPTLF